jgi:hypothetical protein
MLMRVCHVNVETSFFQLIWVPISKFKCGQMCTQVVVEIYFLYMPHIRKKRSFILYIFYDERLKLKLHVFKIQQIKHLFTNDSCIRFGFFLVVVVHQ